MYLQIWRLVNTTILNALITLVCIHSSKIFQGTRLPVVIAASVISGWALVCGLTPFDVVAERLFNQGVDGNGRGLLYRNIFDCFAKTVRHEGMRGLYKGFIANYCRLVPQTILHLTFWEQFKAWNVQYNK